VFSQTLLGRNQIHEKEVLEGARAGEPGREILLSFVVLTEITWFLFFMATSDMGNQKIFLRERPEITGACYYFLIKRQKLPGIW
jgi:hypothetical protein